MNLVLRGASSRGQFFGCARHSVKVAGLDAIRRCDVGRWRRYDLLPTGWPKVDAVTADRMTSGAGGCVQSEAADFVTVEGNALVAICIAFASCAVV